MQNFCNTYEAGESGYYAERQRGTIVVFEDNSKYVYRKVDFPTAKKFKLFAQNAYSNNGRKTVKITGRFPTYYIETLV